jgi:hypothetical protein
MSEESDNPERIDGQLPQVQDLFSDDDIKKIKKKISESLKRSK